MSESTTSNKSFDNPRFISLHKKDEKDLLKGWKCLVTSVLTDIDTFLSSGSYKNLQQLRFEISKTIRSVLKMTSTTNFARFVYCKLYEVCKRLHNLLEHVPPDCYESIDFCHREISNIIDEAEKRF